MEQTYRAWAGRTLFAVLFALMLALPGVAHAADQTKSNPSAATKDSATTPQVRELVTLLADPAVRAWLEAQRDAKPAPVAADPISGAASRFLASRVAAIHAHVVALGEELPRMPGELQSARRLVSADLGAYGLVATVLSLAVLIVLGVGSEWAARWLTRRDPRGDPPGPAPTVGARLRSIGSRLAVDAAALAAFAAGSGIAALAFDLPPLLEEIVLGYLLAVIVLRVAAALGRLMLAPAGDRFRVVPMDDVAAHFWHQRVTLFVGWLAFGWVTVDLLGAMGLSPDGRRLLAYLLGLGLVVVASETAWRRPQTAAWSSRGRNAINALLSFCFVVLWALWVVHAMPVFWFLLIALVLPLAIGLAQRAVDHLLLTVAEDSENGAPSAAEVGFERGARALLIIAAAAALAWAWGIDFGTLANSDKMFNRTVHGALAVVVIALIADVAWHMTKSAIDRKLAETSGAVDPDDEDARRNARLRTLLPILRNMLLIVIVVIAGMMMLSAVGVEIGPLIAGAGVVGVAVGFGAQTLVRDIISGMFYLLDDAFRVGEYIQSGNYRGTVESFSLRSVKLRHHRGPLYTVPFGVLGAVQNQSRDWVIDKMTIGVTYDSDLALAKKLIREIGKQLLDEPDFAPHIIETLKMQGVEQFGDYAVQIRTKMMTRPGEQFVIRRAAYGMIKKAFDANGIKFAFPTVQIAGDGQPGSAAAARQGLELVQPTAT